MLLLSGDLNAGIVNKGIAIKTHSPLTHLATPIIIIIIT